MFENLSTRLQTIFAKLRSRGRLSERDVDDALREVRLALLEADVNFKVVKNFVLAVRERAVGSEVFESLTPGQQVVKIVYEELTKLMGLTPSKLVFAPKPPTSFMLVGLQGSGKTSATAKLAYYLKSLGKRPFMITTDIYRPAAVAQLKTLGEELKTPVFFMDLRTPPLEIAKHGIKEAILNGYDVVILDTAGRLHIDETMMEELRKLREEIHPHQILLVVDAMTGQDAVNLALAFKEKIDFDGVILTKLDGDARGGAALSIKTVTNKPIKLVSVGERLNCLELFHPDRMASRILGMGDILTLIEKAEAAVDARKAQVLEEKLRKGQFTLEDFLNQMQQLKKMGPLNQILGMLPGISGLPAPKNLQISDDELTRLQAIIQSMTPEERRNPNIIDGSRRLRVARGSGNTTQEVNRLLRRFHQIKKLMKQFDSFQGIRLGRKIFLS